MLSRRMDCMEFNHTWIHICSNHRLDPNSTRTMRNATKSTTCVNQLGKVRPSRRQVVEDLGVVSATHLRQRVLSIHHSITQMVYPLYPTSNWAMIVHLDTRVDHLQHVRSMTRVKDFQSSHNNDVLPLVDVWEVHGDIQSHGKRGETAQWSVDPAVPAVPAGSCWATAAYFKPPTSGSWTERGHCSMKHQHK